MGGDVDAGSEPIAIIGVGARFPGAADAAAFWDLLRRGGDAISEVPSDRFDAAALHASGRLSSLAGGFIAGVDCFDAAFFGITPREAVRMDPQQRLALETAWEALDHGGVQAAALRGSATGVFVGAHRAEYGQLGSDDDLTAEAGAARSGVAGRISHVLGLEGPSLVFDTDRSSSLVAVHYACESLRSGECALALAGGVNLVLDPGPSLAFSRAGMLARDGRIKFCDARADGIVRSDGIGFVVLKPLARAEENGDRIFAVILGSATRHDGGASGDLMTPSAKSQTALLRAACARARLAPGHVQYVEAHGTGTVVGDPIEIEALAKVFQGAEGRRAPLRVGSVKTNIGHAESAGGIAGLIKLVFALRHRVLPASLHFEQANPAIAFDGIEVQQKSTDWPSPDERLVAGVTSLGLTGSNAHVLVAERWPRDLTALRIAEPPARVWQRTRYWWPAAVAGSDAPGVDMLNCVRSEVARVLETSAVDDQRPFRELGLTSLLTAELAEGLGRRLGRRVPASVFFNHPNVAALAAHLERPSAGAVPLPRVTAPREPIAIVGYGCRLPGGVDGAAAYWALLRGGVDAIREVPESRWPIADWYDAEAGRPGKTRSKWGGFVDGIEAFDAAFFNVSPREAEEMDPQQRLVLEVAWEALEHAAVPPDRLAGSRSGVFLGMMNNNDYASRKRLADDPARIRAHHGTGIATSITAGRVAYTLGLVGPAITVDTACSSSLVAVHLAMQALRRGECTMALAGGVNALLAPELTVAYSQAGMLSPAGRCKTFDAAADGYVRSEGCGIVVLKRLSDALASGDRVLALLTGAAVNQDGRSSGLTAPNGEAQRAVVREALAEAGVAPAEVGYIEAHGTGTPLGDPIELEALGDVFRGRRPDRPLFVGSVKTNIGHLEAAAGVAGLLKVVAALEHREIPPHLHLARLNPEIARAALPLRVPTALTPWDADRRVAGVSSFGFSGTNAHLIVEEAPAANLEPSVARAAELIVLSAKSEPALRDLARRHANALEGGAPLGDVAFTLATGRAHHAHRLAVVGATGEAVRIALAAARSAEAVSGKTAWLLPGQGAQRAGMGRTLATEWPVFRSAFEEACAAFAPYLARPLREVVWDASSDALDQTAYTQPALFAIGFALAALWRSWGIEPELIAGHSIGELAAAHLAGVFSLEDGARLVAARARLMQALPKGGAMVAIAASEAEVAAAVAVERSVAIAAVNGPASVVVSGDEAAVDAVGTTFRARGVRVKRLVVSHAFHSPRMEPMLDAFRAVAETVRYSAPRVAGVSNLHGAAWQADVATAEYWVRHVRAPVRFAAGISALYAAGARRFVELGPRATASALVPACLPSDAKVVLLPSMRDGRSEAEAVLEALAEHYTSGGAIAWPAVFPLPRRRVALPTYPWQKERHWLSPAPVYAAASQANGLLGARLRIGGVHAVYENELSLDAHPWLGDHRVEGEPVVPAALYVELFRAAAEDALDDATPELRAIAFPAPLRLSEPRRIQVVVQRIDDGWQVSIFGRRADEEAWILHAIATLGAAVPAAPLVDLAAIRARCAPIAGERIYEGLATIGLSYGPSFRGLRALWRAPTEALGHVVVPREIGETRIAPALLDAALQVAVSAGVGLHLPFGIDALAVHALDVREAYVHVRWTEAPSGSLGAEISVVDLQGRAVLALAGFRAKRPVRGLVASGAAIESLFQIGWQPDAGEDGAPLSGACVVVGDRDDALARGIAARLGPSARHVEAHDLVAALPTDNVVCVWSDRAPDGTLAAITSALAIAKRVAGTATRLFWLTRRAHAVMADEVPVPAAAALWGFGRTLREELPELSLRLVDLRDVADAGALDAAIVELARGDEPEVAWCGGVRHVARLLRAPAPKPAPPLRTDGAVLVTGGLGALGRLVARALAERGFTQLVLTGRRGPETPGAAELAAELRALGTEVTIAALDIADRSAVAALLAGLPIRGVVHAAGVLDDGVIAEQTPERLARVLGAKVDGAVHLDELTRDADMDFFVLFSSVVAAVGSVGQAAYGAANAFLDALAASRRAQGLPAVSLGWGPWAEVGMAADLSAAAKERWTRRGIPALSTARALSLFEAALSTRLAPHTIASSFDLDHMRASFGADVPPLWRALVQPTAVPSHDPWTELLGARRLDDVIEAVRVEIARALSLPGPEAVLPDRPLDDLGLDSLTAVELRNVLGRRAGATLPTTLLFDHPTPSALARYLLDRREVPAQPPRPRETSGTEPIAIIGFGCRYPGEVVGPESFWRVLAGEADAIGEVPKERWDIDAFYDPDASAPGKMYTRAGGFLRDLDAFDPDFFEIGAREAVSMDPQQRLLLETSWEALERAGIAPDGLMGTNTGVFVGVMSHEYMELQGADPRHRDGYVTTGSLGSVASGRISYTLGLRGPSMTIDTACSSSLVATHLACQALRTGECDLALAGGATVVLTPSLFVEFSRLRGLARDGRCKSFDASADGVGWSEGCGVIALKRLSDAQRDGDRVLAVIRGSAINQDGRSQGLTAPNGPAQEDVIRRALAQAGVRPAEIDYVEAHGTGTKLGDPIELQALAAVLREGRHDPVVVGSLKSNIGHTQAAAGVGGIIKTLLAFEHELIPRSLHFAVPSPHIPWAELPVRVAAEATPWPRRERPRRAGISSFGISGTNAHVVLEEAPIVERAPAPSRAELVVVSAKTAYALAQAARELRAHWEARPELPLSDVAATLARGRSHRAHRLAIGARGKADALAALAAFEGRASLPASARASVAPASPPKLAWLFTGQGSPWPGMGRGLADEWPVFGDALDRVIAALDVHLRAPLRPIMWGDGDALEQTEFAQPALFALEVALAALWQSWGVEPGLLVGHSVGELAAAYVAGVFSLEDGARLIAARGRLMQDLGPGGAMASIQASEEAVREAIADAPAAIAIAAVNGPRSIVVSGAERAVQAVTASFRARGIATTRLAVSHAFHSPLMDPMLEPFRGVASSIAYRRPARPIVSNGILAGDAIASAEHWVEHVRREVRFADGLRAAEHAGIRAFLELGPRPTLLGLVSAAWSSDDAPALHASMRVDRSEREVILDAVGALFGGGRAITWSAVFRRHERVDLPTYPWQRKRYWADHRVRSVHTEHPFLGAPIERADDGSVLFASELSLGRLPWLADHVVFDEVLFPGTGFLELALAAGRSVGAGVVSELTITAPLPLSDRAVALQLIVDAPSEDDGRAFRVHARRADGSWQRHAVGRLGSARPRETASLAALGDGEPIDAAFYERLALTGLRYGPVFAGLRRLERAHDMVEALVELPESERGEAERYGLHPALLDASLHALMDLFPSTDGSVVLPLEWRDVQLFATGATTLRVRLSVVERSPDGARVVLEARDGAGALALRVSELAVQRATPGALRVSLPLRRLHWTPVAPASESAAADAVVFGSATLATRLALPSVSTLGGSARIVVDATTPRARGVAATHAHIHEALLLLQRWLADTHAGELVWITEGAIAALDDDRIHALEHAPLWGLVRTARTENPHRSIRLIDVEATSTRAAILAALRWNEPELALRSDVVRAPRLEPVSARLRPTPSIAWGSGTVLVTGGTGELGALVARHLVTKHGARRLVLTSRRGADAPGARALQAELASHGAEVVLVACDVSRRDELASLLTSFSPGAPLRAVVHCAGVLDDGALASLTPERVDAVFASKLDAAAHLHELTPSLDALIFFSSVAGIWGTEGQASYAAANAYLDALAAERRRCGQAAQSFVWGLWRPSGAGMTAGLRAADIARLESRGIGALSPEEGLRLFDAALERPESSLVLAKLTTVKHASRSRATASPKERFAGLDRSERSAALRDLVRTEIAAVFRLTSDAVPDAEPLKSLGLDSLIAIELRDRLRRAVGIALPTSLVFDHPTVDELASFLETLLVERAPREAPPLPAQELGAIDALSNEELAALVKAL